VGQNSLAAVTSDYLASPSKAYTDESQFMIQSEGIQVLDLIVDNREHRISVCHLVVLTFKVILLS
jgi:hypothetical protein